MEGRTDETMAAFHLHVHVDHNRERMLEIKAAGRVLIVQNPVPQPGSWSFCRQPTAPAGGFIWKPKCQVCVASSLAQFHD